MPGGPIGCSEARGGDLGKLRLLHRSIQRFASAKLVGKSVVLFRWFKWCLWFVFYLCEPIIRKKSACLVVWNGSCIWTFCEQIFLPLGSWGNKIPIKTWREAFGVGFAPYFWNAGGSLRVVWRICPENQKKESSAIIVWCVALFKAAGSPPKCWGRLSACGISFAIRPSASRWATVHKAVGLERSWRQRRRST